MSFVILPDEPPLLRASHSEQRKRCYRCDGLFIHYPVHGNTGPASEFERHEAECLERARRSAQNDPVHFIEE
jgi:hypothetical protein